MKRKDMDLAAMVSGFEGAWICRGLMPGAWSAVELGWLGYWGAQV